MTIGRTPSWPIPWLDLALRCGGTVQLRECLGYNSKTTLSDKIHGRSPWTRADWLLLLNLCVRHGLDVADLLPARVRQSLVLPGAKPAVGACEGPLPGSKVPHA